MEQARNQTAEGAMHMDLEEVEERSCALRRRYHELEQELHG